MTPYTPLQSVLASVRSHLLNFVALTRNGQGPLAAAMHVELQGTESVNVRSKLLAHDALGAANSSFASVAFKAAVEEQLKPLVAEVVEVLAAELTSPQNCTLKARVPAGMTSHLPGVYVRQGQIDPEVTSDLVAHALVDVLHVAQWICDQKTPARSSAEGFVNYSAGASNFVNRTRMFGERLRVATSEQGKPIYDYKPYVTQTLDPEDEASMSVIDANVLDTFQEERQADGVLTALLHTLVTAHLGVPPSRVFDLLFEALCQDPDLNLCTNPRLLQRCAEQAGVSLEEAQVTAEAIMHAVWHLREQHLP